MNVHLTNYMGYWRKLTRLFLISLIIMLFPICVKELKANSVRCNSDQCSLYHKAAEQMLPALLIAESDNNPYYNLEDGAIVEAFDTQAVGALESGIATNWYPHYLATVIIAIDRDETDLEIDSWNDLYTS